MKERKNIRMMWLGVIFGVTLGLIAGYMSGYIHTGSSDSSSDEIEINPTRVEVLEFDQVYDDLKQEKEAQKEKHWFDDELEQAERETKESIESLEKQGDDAKSEFDKYR